MVRPRKAKAIVCLRKVLNAMPQLHGLRYNSPEFRKRHRHALVVIANSFGAGSKHVEDFDAVHYLPPIAVGAATPDSAFQEACASGLKRAASVLERNWMTRAGGR